MQERDKQQNDSSGSSSADHGHTPQGLNPAAGRVWAGSSARMSEAAPALKAASLRIAGGSAANSAEARNRAQDNDARAYTPAAPLSLSFGPRNRQRIFTPRPVAAAPDTTAAAAAIGAGAPLPPAVNPLTQVQTPAVAQPGTAFSAAPVPMQSVISPSMNIAPQPTQPGAVAASQPAATPSRIASIFRSFFAFGERKQDAAE